MIAIMLTMLVQAETVLVYKTPAGTDAKTVAKAALIMERRIRDYGYKGVIGSDDGTSVRIIFEPGFSPQMVQAIDHLSKIQGQGLLWGIVPMTPREYEQWIPGKTSPPGTSWLIENDIKIIMDDSWKVPMNVKFERFQQTANSATEVRLTFARPESKKFIDLIKAKPINRLQILIDGKTSKAMTGGMVKERRVRRTTSPYSEDATGIVDWTPASSFNPDDETLVTMISVSNPLPVELSVK